MCLNFGGSSQIQLKLYEQNSHHIELLVKKSTPYQLSAYKLKKLSY